MPAITVQKARQRYKRVPVMEPDPENPGQERQKRVEVNRKRRKGNRPVYKHVTENDKSQPLPPQKCERCGSEILPGQEYRCCAIKRQFGGIFRIRCINCPTWQPWEYSDALWARIAQIQNEDVDSSEWGEESEAQDRADELASMIEELVSDKQESLDNMPDGLRDASELSEQVQGLEEWQQTVQDALSDVSFPEGECSNCGGEDITHDEHTDECEDDCDGTEECLECNGSNEGDPTDEQIDEWRQEASDAIRAALDDCPVG